METTTKKEIVQALVNYMNEHKMSQADVAARSKVRKEYVSIIIKPDSNFMYDAGGSQGFIPAKHFNALADLCGYATEKVFWQTQPTEQTSAILANLTDARNNHLTITIIGETGSGKSYNCGLFASKHPIDTFIVTAGSSDTLNDLIDKIIEELNIHTTGSSKSTKLRWIARKMEMLKNYGNKPMIIIDEAEYLKQAALCAMKELYDNLHEFCSLVFIGTDQLVDNIDRLKRRNKSGIPQFHRRIKFGLRILPNIDRSYKLFISDIEDRELKKFILTNCSNYGELHDVIVPATREAERLGEPLTMQLVRKVLNLPEGNMLW
ncbi:AAA family ATPase [Flavobacterium sp.]